MAFVFKSKKEYDYKIGETNHIGPGEYLAQTKVNYVTQSKIPFMFSSSRHNNYNTTTPGPGEYYTDETYLNYLKNLHDGQIATVNNKDLPLMIKQDMTINLESSIEKLGLIKKNKRFKEVEDCNSNIGPGFYCPEILPKKTMFKEHKKNIIEKEKSKSKIRYKKEISGVSIPSNKMIGFDILQDGKLEKKTDPDMYLTFTGEKNDCVGPGTYELDMPSKWHRTGTQWSKLKERRLSDSQKETSEKTMMNTKKSMDDCFILSNSITNNNKHNNTTKGDKRMNNNKSFTTFIKSYRNKSLNNITTINKKEQTHKGNSEQNIPGPGYYFNMNKMSSFNIKKHFKDNQFFGSRIDRFSKTLKDNNCNIGPGTYYYQNLSQQSKNKLVPFGSNIQKSFQFEEISSIGPGTYNQQSQFDKSISSSQIQKFGSTEKRFINQSNGNRSDYDLPGPGSYFQIMNHINRSYPIKWNSMINSNHKRRIVKSKSYNLIALNKHETPCVGQYHSDMYYSIDYKNQKKSKKSREIGDNSQIAFNSMVRKEIELPMKKNNLGPGYYLKENIIKPKQIYPPFNQGNQKALNDKNYKNLSIGPGDYIADKYFDWNKKTYNVNYI